MKQLSRRLALFAGAVASVAYAARASAQETAVADTTSELVQHLIATLVFGGLGIVLALVGIKAFEMVQPYSVRKELEEDQNIAVGMVIASMTLGLSIIIAATILS